MFTGIIERLASVLSITDAPRARRLLLASSWDDVRVGESIAINGVCLTVADVAENSIAFDVIAETLDRTNLGDLKTGDAVHVERALRVGDRISGHFVQGHVDGLATIVEQNELPGEWRIKLELLSDLAKFLSPKGSVTLDGVSLTIASLDGNQFEVALIPTTRTLTTLAKRPIGSTCNFEADTIAKSVVHFLESRGT